MRKTRIISFFTTTCITSVILSFGCGVGNQTPDSGVEDSATFTVADGNGATIEMMNTTDVNPLPIEITFSKEMDDDTIVQDAATGGNTSLTCSGAEVPIVIAPSESEENTYVVTPADGSGICQATCGECTLTVSDSVTDAEGVPVAEAAYTFETSCRVSNYYKGPTISEDDVACWYLYSEFISGEQASILEDILNYDAATGELNYNATGLEGTSGVELFKGVSLDYDFEIVISGVFTNGLTAYESTAGDSLEFSLLDESQSNRVNVEVCTSTNLDRVVGATYTSNNEIIASSSKDYTLGGEFYLRIRQSGSEMTASYKLGDADYQDFDAVNFPDDISSYAYFSIGFKDRANTNIATIHSIQSSGITTSTAQ